MIDRGFHNFDVETFFIVSLKMYGVAIRRGSTDDAIRKQRIRAAILDSKKSDETIGSFAGSGRNETYKQLFERHYGEPLLTTAKPEGKTKC